MIVVDASVAVKWLIEEPDSAAAAAILESGDDLLFAPALVRIEVANAIVRRMRENKLSKAKAESACREWERMLQEGVVELKSDAELVEEAIRLALDIRHTVPDCLYLALAIALGATVLTADHGLYERGRKVHGAMRQLGKSA